MDKDDLNLLCDRILGDTFFELAGDFFDGVPDVERAEEFACYAFGFYRQCEDYYGMIQCSDFFRVREECELHGFELQREEKLICLKGNLATFILTYRPTEDEIRDSAKGSVAHHYLKAK